MSRTEAANLFNRWRSHLESRLRPTHRISLKEIISPSVVLASFCGITRSPLRGAPHFPEKLWAEAIKAAVCIRNRTPTDALGGKAPVELWECKPLGNRK